MRLDSPLSPRLATSARVVIDALAYAVVVTAITVIVALVVGIATGGGLVRGKALVFLGGWVMMGYATVRLWPSSREDAEPRPMAQVGGSLPESPDATRFQAFVQAIPPNRWIHTPRPEHRVQLPGKLWLASVLMLLTSFLMEVAFGIR